MIEVKRVEFDEWKKFRDIRIRAIEDSPQAFGDTLEVTRERQKEVWLTWIDGAYNYVIEVNNKFQSLGTFRQDENNDWVINGVWTDPEFRGRGYSKKIFNTILEKAKSLYVKEIVLSVNPVQKEAFNLYTKLGFKVVGEEEVELGDGTKQMIIKMLLRLG